MHPGCRRLHGNGWRWRRKHTVVPPSSSSGAWRTACSANPQVLADFAAIRKAKRKGPVTAAVIEEICQQAHLAGLTLEQALQTCCDPRRKWARFEASWLQAAPGGWASTATTAATPAPALWKPPVAKPAAPEVVAAGRARIAALRQATVGAGLGSSKGCGWAHAAIEKHQSGQPVRRAVLLDACAALKLNPASLAAARMHCAFEATGAQR